MVQCDEASSASSLGATQENGNVIKDTPVKVLTVPGASPWPYPSRSRSARLGFPFLGQGAGGSENPRMYPRKLMSMCGCELRAQFPRRGSVVPHKCGGQATRSLS